MVQRYCDLEQSYRLNSATPSTRHNDLLRWAKYWVPFCTMLDTPVWRSDPDAVKPDSPYYEAELFVSYAFLLFVWDHMRPRRKTDEQAKPSSVLQVWLAIN